ncbi:MAG: DUF4337 domain-containing protein [Hyphomonadaceae bacterium]|nr:DUF4337 domain-containing protein [Hyphomonadaceae bacterium]
MAEIEVEGERAIANERFTNLIALTIALLVTFLAISTIKSGNVQEAVEQAQAERNNSWAWYQAVRVREDMATYELAHLQRLLRTVPAAAAAAAPGADGVVATAPPPSAERETLRAEIREQEAEVGRVRARKDETEARAKAAETQLARLNVFADQYDFSDALLAISMALFAICALAKVRWLYWFSMLPAMAGLAWGAASMAQFAIPAQAVLGWLN